LRSDPRKPLAALGCAALVALVAMACGEIAGLRDPDVAAGGAPEGGLVPSPDGQDDVLIEPSAIDIGSVACGTASGDVKNIVIKNRGGTTPKYSVKVAEGSGFELQGPAEGQLGKDATVTVGVVARPNLPGELTGEISVTAGTVTSQIAVKAMAQGARFEVAPSIANIGAVRRENGGSLDVALTNTGNQAATITKVDSSLPDFSATWEGHPAPLSIDAGATKTIKVTLGGGNDSAVLQAMLTFGVDGVVCGGAPLLPVEGQRVNQDVTISPADFGKQFCTTTPTLQRDVVISNYTSSTLAYTASLKSGAASLFNVVSGAADTIPPGSSSTPTTKAVKLSMKTIPGSVGPVNEVVDIEISGIAAPSGGPRTAAATADIRGVILTITPSEMTGFGNDQSRGVTFTNSGNENWTFGSYFIRESGTTNYGAWDAFNFGSVNASSVRASTVRFNPTYCGYYAGSWTFTTPNGVPFCNGNRTLRVQGSACN
jgi:hypothetical protein